MENTEHNNPDDVRNRDQKEELAVANSTMQKNLAGANIDARDTSEQSLERGLKRERADGGHFEQVLDSALLGHGGEFIADVEQGGTMRLDPNQDI